MSEFYILHFNDVYDIEEQVREPKGGAARFLTAIREIKKHFNTLTLFSGDMFSPSSLSNIYKGEQMIYPALEFGIDVACMGNHDFDFPLVQVRNLLDRVSVPWLMSNVHNTQTGNNLADALPHFIKQVGSFKIGFFGLAESEWLGQIDAIPQSMMEYEDFVHCAERSIQYLRQDQGCNLIIALTHMRVPNDHHLIQSLPAGAIDIVLGGHDHIWHREKIMNTFYAKSGTNFRNLGFIAINAKKGWFENLQQIFQQFKVELHKPDVYQIGNIELSYVPIDIVESITPEPTMQAYVNEKIEKYNQETLKVIAYTGVELDTRFSEIRVKETNCANLFADILRLEYEADVCVINTGTMRSDELLKAGPITYQTIDKIFAIPDVLVCYRITGYELHQTLENGVSKSPSCDGRFLAVSGIRFKYSLNREPMSRIKVEDIEINGQPLDHQKVYKMITKSFIADGYDGFKPVKSNYIFDKGAGIPIKTIFLQFFETIREHPVLRKMSQDREEHEPQAIRISDLDLHPPKEEDETLLDKRYRRFKSIISDIIVQEMEPYLILSPVVDGRIKQI